MKKLVTSYTFDASEKTIVSADFTSLEKIQLITNVTDNVIIYNFADQTKGGSHTGTTLTLTYDTTLMDDADKLQIFVEDPAVTLPATQSGTWIVQPGNTANTTAWKVDGSAVTQPISHTALTELAAAIDTEVQVDVVSSALPSGAATSAKQDTVIGHLDGVETVLGTIDTDTGNISTKVDTLAGAVSGSEMQVDVLTMPTVTVNSHAVTNAGTFATQVDGAALTALQLIDDIVYTDDTSTHSTGTTKVMGIGAVATPSDASVNANDIGMPAMTTDRKLHVSVQDALPAGTNAIGKLAANSGVDIGDVDVTSVLGTVTTKGIPSDIDINGSNPNHADKYYTNAGAVTDGIVWSPAAGKRWHITSLYINVSAAATVTLEDDLVAGDNPRWKGELAANSGVFMTYDKEHPFCSTEDAADLLITTTAGNVYVQAVGYEV